jgi:hypothetical protein
MSKRHTEADHRRAQERQAKRIREAHQQSGSEISYERALEKAREYGRRHDRRHDD